LRHLRLLSSRWLVVHGLIISAEEGRAAAKAAAPEDATPQDIMKLGAAMWSKLTAKQKAPWEKRAAEEKRDASKAASKAAREAEQARLAKEREAALRRLLAGLAGSGAGALELADELWPDDEQENAELLAGLHTVAAAMGGTLPVPSWRAGGGGGRGGAGGKKRQRTGAAAAVDLFD
jgi:hypothetical protein